MQFRQDFRPCFLRLGGGLRSLFWDSEGITGLRSFWDKIWCCRKMFWNVSCFAPIVPPPYSNTRASGLGLFWLKRNTFLQIKGKKLCSNYLVIFSLYTKFIFCWKECFTSLYQVYLGFLCRCWAFMDKEMKTKMKNFWSQKTS